jgi:hypothetical protein
MNLTKWFATGFLALSVSAGGMAAAKQPDAQITIDETQFGFVIGGSVGEGVLNIDGKKHPFKIGGLGVGANIGISKMSASGNVYDLKKLEDFPGNYGRVGGSVAAGVGTGGMTLRNEKGVTLELKGTTEGLQFDISASGVNIYFPK